MIVGMLKALEILAIQCRKHILITIISTVFRLQNTTVVVGDNDDEWKPTYTAGTQLVNNAFNRSNS